MTPGLSRPRPRVHALLGTALALIVVLTLPLDAAAGRRAPGDRITGWITLDGCTMGPGDLTLRARYLTSGAIGAAAEAPVRSSRPEDARSATIAATTDPHVLAFTLTDLQPGKLYQLVIRPADTRTASYPADCSRIFWRGPYGGLAIAGGAPVRIEGLAARTQLEVMRPPVDVANADTWRGSDHLDLSRQDWSIRSFRWRTTLPAIQAGELQIATEAFPVVSDDAGSCAEPEGAVIFRTTVETSESEWLQLPQIDLAAVLAPSRTGAPRDDGIDVAAAGAVAPMTDEAYARILAGAPLWVRVVPLRADGPACDPREDGVHGWVNLARIAAAALEEMEDDPATLNLGSGHRYDAPFFDPSGRPYGDQYAYLVTQPHQLPSKKAAFSLAGIVTDPVGSMLVRDHSKLAGTWLYPGAYIIIDPGDPGWWEELTDSIGSLVTGAIDAIGFLVDKISKVYAEIKAAVVKIGLQVVLAIPVVSAACNAVGTETCRKAVVAAVDAGLASMGMPPSLPNWNELQAEGVDYLAAELASQTGVPAEVTAKALELGQEAMDGLSANRGGSGPQYSWLMPYYGFDPAVAYISLRKEGDDPLPPLMTLEIAEDDLFLAESILLPRQWAGDLLIPVVLEPNVQGVAAPVCTLLVSEVPCPEAVLARHYRDQYKARINADTCANLKSATRQFVPTGAIPPIAQVAPPAGLKVSMFTLIDEPREDLVWSGKFFGVCT